MSDVLLILVLGSLRLGVPVDAVERVVRAVEVTPLARAPVAVPGIVNVQGSIVPVVDLRARFGMERRDVHVDDQFVLVRLPQRMLAILANDVVDVCSFDSASIVPAVDVAPWLDRIRGVVRMQDGLLLVTDPAAFLDLDEWQAIDAAVEEGA